MRSEVIRTLLFALLFQSCAFGETADSLKLEQITRVNNFITSLLGSEVMSPELIEKEIDSKHDNDTISLLATFCRVSSYSDTSKPKGNIEAAERLAVCFAICVRTLRKKQATAELRRIYFSVRLEDGWLMLWDRELGGGWRKMLRLE